MMDEAILLVMAGLSMIPNFFGRLGLEQRRPSIASAGSTANLVLFQAVLDRVLTLNLEIQFGAKT